MRPCGAAGVAGQSSSFASFTSLVLPIHAGRSQALGSRDARTTVLSETRPEAGLTLVRVLRGGLELGEYLGRLRAGRTGCSRQPLGIDLGLIFGLGFPPFKGGLLYWADTIGAAKLLEMIKPLEPLGARFQPTPLLKEMAAGGRKFYPRGGE